MSSLLELLGRGLEASVSETLDRCFRTNSRRPLAELKDLAAEHPDWPDVQCELGVACLAGMQLADAVKHLEQACRHKPDYLEARLALASAHDEMGRPAKAVEHLHIANQTHSGSTPVLFAIGYCLEKLDRSDEAAEYYRDAVAADDGYVAAHQRLAAIALLRDDVPEAIDCYEKLRELSGDTPEILAALANLYYRDGRYADAVATYETVIALEPDNWALIDDEVEALVQAGQLREGVERLYGLLEMQGPFPDLHLRLGELLSKIGDDEDATRHYLSALESDPDYLEAHISFGAHHLGNGRWEEAAESFHHAAELNDRLLVGYIGLGVSQAASGKWSRAVETFELAAAIEPNSTLLVSEMAKLQLRAAAAAEFQEGFSLPQGAPVAEAELDNDDLLHVQIQRHAEEVQKHPQYADAHYRYGVLLRSEGRLGEALEHFSRAVEINPSYTSAIIRLGMTQQELGRLEEAIETFKNALQLKPEYVDLHYRLALLHTDRQDFERAVEHMEKAAHLAPGNQQIRAALALSLQNMGLIDRVAATWRTLSQMHRAAREKHSENS